MFRLAKNTDLMRLRLTSPKDMVDPTRHSHFLWGLKHMGYLLTADVLLRNILGIHSFDHLSATSDRPRILEVGAGLSDVLYQRVADCVEYWVVDKAGFYEEERYNETVKRRAKASHVDAFMGESTDLLQNEYFDLVTSVSVLEHIPFDQIDRAVQDMHRVLRPGGFFVHTLDVRRHRHSKVWPEFMRCIERLKFEFLEPPESIDFSADGILFEPLSIDYHARTKQAGDLHAKLEAVGANTATILIVARKQQIRGEADIVMPENEERGLLLKRWKAIEQSIVADSDHEYNLEWGRLREKFYEENSPIPCSNADMKRLSALKNAFKGERIFILGNGPSLNKTPLELLKDEFTFVTNRFYLMFDRIGWRPTFYTATDWRVIPDIAHEINLLTGMIFFFEERFRGLLRADDEDIYWYTHTSTISPEEKRFACDLTNGCRGCGSVTGSAIQIAFYMGFSPIYLIGCDLGYKVGATVKQEGPDKFGTGTRLYLTSTEDDDASHFDKRYFGKDRRWHDPHVERMIEGHKQCKEGIERAGGRIFNATIGGELEVYERVDFTTLFPGPKQMLGKQLLHKIKKPIQVVYPVTRSGVEDGFLGPFGRCEHANLSETQIAFQLLKSTKSGVMVDVGAHHGQSLLPFAKNGWRVYAFEPDPKNRDILAEKVCGFPNVTVDARAVSNTSQRSVPFYSSEESTGISCLRAFHNSHVEAGAVDTVTLHDFCTKQNISAIDLLKIDTEGYEMPVLSGFPWESMKPRVILAEFEDFKTEALGYTMHDMARYLNERGYTVLVSEWHPIVRYGVRHDWHRLVRYPCELNDPSAWGNLIAFLEDPGDDRLRSVARETLRFPGWGDGESGSPSAARPASLPIQLYERMLYKFGPYVVRRHPRLANLYRRMRDKGLLPR